MCLSVVLLINNYHCWIGCKGKTATFVVKPSVIVQEKQLFHENSCCVCEREITLK